MGTAISNCEITTPYAGFEGMLLSMCGKLTIEKLKVSYHRCMHVSMLACFLFVTYFLRSSFTISSFSFLLLHAQCRTVSLFLSITLGSVVHENYIILCIQKLHKHKLFAHVHLITNLLLVSMMVTRVSCM